VGVCTCGYGNMSFLCMWDFVMCRFCNVCVCVCVCECLGFVMCEIVYVWVL